MSVRADAESLRQLPVFRDCDPVALQVMAFAAERQTFIPGEIIIGQGKKALSAFFIMSGAVDVLQGDTPIAQAEPGSLLGEMAMMAGVLYSITARAGTAVTAARIDRTLFLRVADEYPAFGKAVLGAISRRLDDSVKELGTVRAQILKSKGFEDIAG
jgi:CRP-like cAMP-binding protein